MPNPTPITWAMLVFCVVGALLAFLAFFLLLSWIISFLSGWRILAHRYAAPDVCQNCSCTASWPDASMGFLQIPMGRLLQICVRADGLFLTMRFQHWLGYRPLLIPWQDIVMSPSRAAFSPWPTYALTFRQCPRVPLHLPVPAVQAFTPYLQLPKPQPTTIAV